VRLNRSRVKKIVLKDEEIISPIAIAPRLCLHIIHLDDRLILLGMDALASKVSYTSIIGKRLSRKHTGKFFFDAGLMMLFESSVQS